MAELMESMVRGVDLKEGSPIPVVYGRGYKQHTLRLLELDESLLQKIMAGSKVIIKGAAAGHAVLCTEDQTFVVKEVENSNVVLLFAPSGIEDSSRMDTDQATSREGEHNGEGDSKPVQAEALASVNSTLELMEIVPSLDVLKGLLHERPYSQEDEDEEEMYGFDPEGPRRGLYTWNDLVDRVQASEVQLRDMLDRLHAVEVDGYQRAVSDKYMQGLLDIILATMAENEWPLSRVPEDAVLAAVRPAGYSVTIARHCLAVHGVRLASAGPSDRNSDPDEAGADPVVEDGRGAEGQAVVWSLDPEKICRHRARQLLSSGLSWREQDFMSVWEDNLPAGIKPSMSMLGGLALVETKGPERFVQLLWADSMPYNAEKRFDILFRRRQQWVRDDLEPYLRDMCNHLTKMEDLILKYTRMIQVYSEDVPLFCRR